MTTLPTHREAVRPEWIDYNGHMSEAFYVLVFGHATDGVMAYLGMDEAYRTHTGRSLYTVEAHVRYLREVSEGASLAVTSTVAAFDDKRLHLCHEMAVDGGTVATEEIMALHVDGATGRTAPFPDGIRDNMRALTASPPAWAGRRIAVPARG
ncbi:thioesterase family protein [Ferruginivarius sediminum]|uniref:Thioesterase n=1 Tax=Ferruginivarius sediminum TaxID=2661937 RepID=A0A369T4L8_9PROT|nr:thioesterase family protein [Ferruginivarius sediminum]RDD60269.1 thioesterase [Ferruginivarius sediminum]